MGVLNRVGASFFAVAIVAVSAPLGARASSLEIYGFGPRASGMGLTGTAAAEGNYALYYNPAALVGMKGARVEIAYQIAPTRLTLNGESIGAREPRATEVGIGFGLSSFGRPSGLGFALHVPDHGLYGVRVRPESAPEFAVLDTRRDRVHVLAGYAISPIDKVEIGVGSSLLSDTLARMIITQTGAQRADMDARLIPTQTLHAGVRVGPWSGFRAGLSYREEHISILSIPTDLRAELGGINGEVLVRGRTFIYFTPRQASFGVSWEKGPLLATSDLTWNQWSGMPDPNGSRSFTVIDHGGNLPPSPPKGFAEDPGFRNTVSPRAGAEWKALRGERMGLTLRGGYAFEPTPAPAPSPTRNLVDLDRHLFTAGARISFVEPPAVAGSVDLETYVVYAHLAERTVIRDDPTDPVGAYRAGGTMWAVGLAATFHFDVAYLR